MLCHSCRNAIPEGSAFCPECGAPQLRVRGLAEREEQAAKEEPGPQPVGEIAWPAAVKSAALWSLPAGFLLSFAGLPLLNMLWVVLGAVYTLKRYRKRAPRAPKLTPVLGGRIGLVLGLFAAVIATALNAVTALVQRYGLHRGGLLDAQFQQVLEGTVERIRDANPDAAAQLPSLVSFWLSPDGRGTLLVVSALSSAVSMLAFAWLTGWITVRYDGLRRKKDQQAG